MANQSDLRVQPELLKNKADEISAYRATLQTHLEDIRIEVEKIKNNWMSETSDEFQAKFAQTKDDVDRILADVQEYAQDLIEIANAYSTAESNIKAKIDSLPVDLKL